MGLTVIFRNIRGDPFDNNRVIAEVVKNHYSKYYLATREQLETWKLYSSLNGNYVSTWPLLPHLQNFFIINFASFDQYIDHFSINNNAEIENQYTDIEDPPQTKLEYHINKCLIDLENAARYHKPSQISYLYVIIMLGLFNYYIDTGIEMNEDHRSIILSTLAQEANSIYKFHEFLRIYKDKFNNPWFSKEFSLSGPAQNRMIMESILKSYDITSGENVFRFFKGIYISKFILSLEDSVESNSISKEYVAEFIADLIRLCYSTIKLQTYVTKIFTNGWQNIDNETVLVRSMRSFENLVEYYVDEQLMEILDIPEHRLFIIMEGLTKVAERMSTRTLKQALCINNFGVMVSNYNRVLTFSNVTLDLNLMKVRDHYPHDLSEHSIPYTYDTFVNRQRQMMLDKFMGDLFDDVDLIHYMYTIFGRALRGNVLDKAFWVFQGPSNAGKSRFTDMVAKAFGEYSVTLSADIFNSQNRNSSSATPDLNMIVGRLVGFVQEPRRGRVDIEAIKERTGDERLYVRALYQAGTNVKNTIKLFMVLNHIQFNSSDAALWNRMRVVQFKRIFVSKEEYDNLSMIVDPDEFQATYRLASYDIDRIIDFIAPEFMNRCIMQYFNTLHMPLIDPPIIKEFVKSFRMENDNIFLFINTVYEPTHSQEDTTPLQYAYERYKDWFSERTADTRNLLTLPMFRDGVRSSGLSVMNGVILGLKDKIDINAIMPVPTYRTRTIEMGNSLKLAFNVDSLISTD